MAFGQCRNPVKAIEQNFLNGRLYLNPVRSHPLYAMDKFRRNSAIARVAVHFSKVENWDKPPCP